MSVDVVDWLRSSLSTYTLEPVAVYKKNGSHDWPLVANNEDELLDQLDRGEHFIALPKEPAALANIVEVSVVDFLLKDISSQSGFKGVKGTERGYPDVEMIVSDVSDRYYAIDVKVARRHENKKKTQSKITLYTGNTYFRFPSLHWSGTFRPFEDYEKHIDVLFIYTLDENIKGRIVDPEIIVQESWRIASKQRSSTTREYIGAVQSLEKLRGGDGEFEKEADFYSFWRKYGFKIGPQVQKELDKLLRERKSK